MSDNEQIKINEIFAGMDEVMAAEERRLNSIAPKCHFRPMMFDTLDNEAWWECSYCGHIKEI